MTPIMMDPPEHTKFRAPLQKAFSPKSALALKGEIDELANSLVDAVVDQGHCEFIGAVAEQLPVRVFLKMMGLPADRLPAFRALVRELLAPRTDMLEDVRRTCQIADAMRDVILARRTAPQDDLISELWSLQIDGEPMSLELMEDYTSLLFVAGLDTVINAMGYGMRHLARNPDLQRELRANPKLIPEAAEELLRRYSFTVPIRRATRDTELAGWTLKSGDHVYLYMAAADLDAREFPSPEVFDVGRENNVHIAFGAGPHRCLGSHLARIELQSLYNVVLNKLPLFRLDPDKSVEFAPGNIISVVSLPLRWD
jgi:cytochrome P450